MLRLARCDTAQGFLLARPMVAKEVHQLLGDDLMGRLVDPGGHLSATPASARLVACELQS